MEGRLQREPIGIYCQKPLPLRHRPDSFAIPSCHHHRSTGWCRGRAGKGLIM